MSKQKLNNCTVEGCDKDIRAKGLCTKHYARKERTGTTDRLRGGDPKKCIHCGKTHHATTDKRRGLCRSCYEDRDIASQYGKFAVHKPRKPNDYWKAYSCDGKKKDGTSCDREVVTKNEDGKYICNPHAQMYKKHGRIEYLERVKGTCTINDDTCSKTYYGHGYCGSHWKRKENYGDPHKFHPRTNMQPSDKKTCTQCLIKKPIDQFANNKACKYDGKKAKCKMCISENYKAYRNNPKNKAQIKANRKRWYEENKESEIQKSLDWLKANPDKVKTSRDKYSAKHREKLNKKAKAYRLANIEKVNRKDQERTRIYRAKKANAVSDGHTIAELQQYWEDKNIDPKLCTYCDAWHTEWGHNWKWSQGDHVVPLDKGGTDCMDNLMPCCRTCNSSKGSKLLSEWTQPKHEKKAA